MAFWFFVLMVAALGLLLAISALIAHAPIGRHTAGWWTGIAISIIMLSASASEFERLPTRSQSDGCSTSQVTDWDEVATDAVRINWISLAVGVVFAFVAIEILSRIEISDKILALILLIVAFSTSFLMVYVFAMRKLTYILFSFTMGSLVGTLIDTAFFSDRLWSKIHQDREDQEQEEHARQRRHSGRR